MKQPSNRPGIWKQKLVINEAQTIIIAVAVGFAMLMTILSGAFSNFYVRNVQTAEPRVIAILIFFLFFVFVAGCIQFVLFTQKLFGPLWRLHTHIQQRLAGQNPPPIELRKGDYLYDLIADYNKTLAQK